jgi:lipopolysaccharide/colanic/teichoic acid biosynthesis glycosyltransferase
MAAAVLILVAAAPVMLVAFVLVKLTSRGPVFYTQTRLGQYGVPYRLYKIRSMHHNCERSGGARWCVPGDPRVTPVGRLLRALHVDELPQLWNVIRGDMSLIGPRPERPEFVPHLEQFVPRYRERLAVRPGLSGLAQVQLPADTDLDSVRRKTACDLYYVHHVGPWLDLRLTLATACYLAGAPFGLSRTLFRVPDLADAQRHYDTLLAVSEGDAVEEAAETVPEALLPVAGPEEQATRR